MMFKLCKVLKGGICLDLYSNEAVENKMFNIILLIQLLLVRVTCFILDFYKFLTLTSDN